ncbi:MAG: response regulator transcription factor [Candidatus Pacebacteria bacterium]|nr:response regulator transcription factor [Candidatus Paceibacterota bacterium]
MSQINCTKVVIADDHPIFRRGLVDLIESDSSFTIVGESDCGEKAIDLIKKLKPDIAVVDLSMPDISGLEVVKEIRKTNLTVEFIILTIYKNEEYISKAIDLNVRGYILKENTEDDLLTSLKSVAKGDYYMSHLLSSHLISKKRNMEEFEAKIPSIKSLTTTERRVLKLTAENKSCKEIAEEMCISPKTVENHRSNISNKLNLKGRNKLLQFAIENKSTI